MGRKRKVGEESFAEIAERARVEGTGSSGQPVQYRSPTAERE